MLKRHKDLLRAIVAPLRNTLAGTTQADGAWLRGDLDRELERLGIAPGGALTPMDALPNASAAERRARYAAEAAIATAVNGLRGAEAERKRADARSEVIERAAYTWINRLLALRAMETRGLIDETLRGNPDYDGVSEALYILRSDAPARSAGNDGGWWAVLEDACMAQAESLPGLFDLGDPAAALRPSTAALLRCLALVGAAPSGYTLEEADAAFADPDAIGWCYQFYQEAAKARVYAKLGSGGKAASRAEIAAATQLFTEPYMVQWLLQNSLGRSYHEAYPDSTLPATWDYYIRQEPTPEQRTKNKEQKDPTISNLQSPISKRPGNDQLPITNYQSPISTLQSLTLIDPCCGSGHFLREAFDMFAAMYRERHPELTAAEIADRVLERHLHGIDLDPRAAQLAALTLYLRAWEYMKTEGKRQKAKGNSAIVYRPSSLNIATTPSGLSAGALQRHLRRHPEDRVMTPLLEGVFAALEQADILGSLLRPAEHIDAAIKALQTPHTMQMDFDADDAALRRTITALAGSDPAELKRMLLERVAQSFHAEAGAADDVAAQLFGREAEGGVRLLQLLDCKYAVVVTNPPYMGSSNMDDLLRKYVEKNYRSGKRDLYATFILRCFEMTRENGKAALITLQSYLSNSSYESLREFVVQNVEINSIVSLGRHAFGEIDPAGNPVLLIISHSTPNDNSLFYGYRIGAPMDSEVQARTLRSALSIDGFSGFQRNYQSAFLHIQGTVLCFWLPNNMLQILANSRKIDDIAEVRAGLTTSESLHFYRLFWEIGYSSLEDWYPIANSGGYRRWFGLNRDRIRWSNGYQQVLSNIGNKLPSREYYGRVGAELTQGTSGSLCARLFTGSAFSNSSVAVFPRKGYTPNHILWLLNSRCLSYYLRAICHKKFGFEAGHIRALPIPKEMDEIEHLVQYVVKARTQIASTEVIDTIFQYRESIDSLNLLELLQSCLESVLEKWLLSRMKVCDYSEVIFADTGTPAGFHPLLAGYDALPDLPADLELPSLPQEVIDYLATHQRIAPPPAELQRIKARLRGLYEAGPGVKESEEVTEGAEEGEPDGEEAAMSGAHIPIPTETFLEELSVKLQLHPISVYWLLEKLRREGARCKPEELRLLENRLSVLVLRLLGHHWPRQIEAGKLVPSWADEDGIIPLTAGAGQPMLAERLRGRLRDEDGDLGAQRAEALLHELTGLSLEDWLRREFFKRHVRQFKYRPIAWHLASDPSVAMGDAKAKKRMGGRHQPAFECLVYYHACGGDVLARIRTQYVEPLLRGARQQLEHASQAKDDSGLLQANLRIQELEEFNRRLQAIAERGFASPELDKLVASEPLDRWSGDGYLAPADRDALLRQEQGWRVDLNDGVRVNIAPVQQAGLLASDVLKAVDAKKAIADRARWRSDERRWVRAGKLPRCGWMGDYVHESAEWTRLAPQREAERARLEEKRRAISNQSKINS